MKPFNQTSTKRYQLLGIFTFLMLWVVKPGFSQFSDYEKLAFHDNLPDIYFSTFTLPGAQENSLQFTTIFRLNYNFLPFKRLNSSTKEAEFFSTAKLNIEVYKSPRKGLKPHEQISVDNLPSVGRDQWQGTAYAANYEQTKADSIAISGSMQVEVSPGYYTYFLELKRNEGTKGQDSRIRNVRLYPYNKQRHGDLILAKKREISGLPSALKLLNMGNHVYYGQDFTAFIHLSNYDPDTNYKVEVHRVNIRDRDTTRIELMHEQVIAKQQLYTSLLPALKEVNDQLMLELQQNDNGFAYAILTIPNHAFPNAVYQLTVTADNRQEPVAEGIFRSYWANMPTSLLSLDVAIGMLRFITNEATIDRIDSGSDQQREQKFRSFWKEKDPTPQTQINELQTEYYRRIDYAYEHFSSNQTLGFNSDQGKIYIVYGPPDDIKRVFPTEGPTKEIWTYGSKKFIFKATSGFGDFVLISNSK